MSGPALKELHAHRAIHDAAYGEAEELTGVFRHCVEEGRYDAALAAAELVVEHWHTRTLRHAAEEEAGFYREVAEQHPNRSEDIAALVRDHDLMRQLVAEVEERLAISAVPTGTEESASRLETLGAGVSNRRLEEMRIRFEMLLWLGERHSREEERRLLGVEEGRGVHELG
ncbi:MAG: hemerythrin domain-containing protein [Alicyclobacillus macrosporangiidus]|uniref:hemerythrin domain-containing protein n=1 Tax=Alicyclobacillus macrosporangiidus TaxID=392015 RepID=UPI0026F02A3F|nr:hemerythrin domain-containing protein [Alicyclobacillus macrosporangiidus]MCL6597384.1 hemerythrin domain-containing protein [Alicyclobacillus macrosporangiidus]